MGVDECRCLRCEQLHPALFLLTGAARQSQHERLRAGAHEVQLGVDGGDAVEARHSLGPGPKLAGGLWAAQQQHGYEAKCWLVETQALVEHLAVAGCRAAVRGIDEADEPIVLQRGQCPLHGAAVVGDNRVAVRGLVAGRYQRVEAQRVLLWRRQLLFDEAADHPPLLEAQAHKAIIRVVSCSRISVLSGALNLSGR